MGVGWWVGEKLCGTTDRGPSCRSFSSVRALAQGIRNELCTITLPGYMNVALVIFFGM